MCIHIYFKRMKNSSIVYCPGLPLICTQGEDRPLFRWSVTRFTLQRYWSDTKTVLVGSTVDKLALGQSFPVTVQFSWELSLHHTPHSCIYHMELEPQV